MEQNKGIRFSDGTELTYSDLKPGGDSGAYLTLYLTRAEGPPSTGLSMAKYDYPDGRFYDVRGFSEHDVREHGARLSMIAPSIYASLAGRAWEGGESRHAQVERFLREYAKLSEMPGPQEKARPRPTMGRAAAGRAGEGTRGRPSCRT